MASSWRVRVAPPGFWCVRVAQRASGSIRTVQEQSQSTPVKLGITGSSSTSARTEPERHEHHRGNNRHAFRTVLDARVNRATDELWRCGDGDSRIAHNDSASRSDEMSDSGASETTNRVERVSNSSTEVQVTSGHTAKHHLRHVMTREGCSAQEADSGEDRLRS